MAKYLVPLDVALRDSLVARICSRLSDAAIGSEVVQRGSLATGASDKFSDIDLSWIVPDEEFSGCLERLSGVLSGLAPIDSLRSDPDFQNSSKRRLIYVRFAGLPLFWRLDLEVLSKSIAAQPLFDVNNLQVRGTNWSLAESALANAVGAAKAYVRGSQAEAWALLQRGYERVSLRLEADRVPSAIVALSEGIQHLDPAVTAFARQVIELAKEISEDGS